MRFNGLGKGLESLIPRDILSTTQGNNNDGVKTKESIFLIEVERIRENPYQPRRDFNQEELQSLSSSIREHGVLQPIIVTKNEEETSTGIKVFYELVAGERRLKASKMAGLDFIPAIIRQKTEEKQKLELALVENVQRQDLNAVEKAKGYDKLIKDFGLTQKEVAEKVGQSRELIANTVRLLNLPVEIQKAIELGRISEGHGRAILSLPDDNQRMSFLNEIISKNLSVRAAESFGRQVKGVAKRVSQTYADPQTKHLESQLEEFLGTRVKLAKSGAHGRILIEFYSPEELTAILDKILKV